MNWKLDLRRCLTRNTSPFSGHRDEIQLQTEGMEFQVSLRV